VHELNRQLHTVSGEFNQEFIQNNNDSGIDIKVIECDDDDTDLDCEFFDGDNYDDDVYKIDNDEIEKPALIELVNEYSRQINDDLTYSYSSIDNDIPPGSKCPYGFKAQILNSHDQDSSLLRIFCWLLSTVFCCKEYEW
jgi:hypothetical protein